jgi:SAM-dependent methyltransferase
VLNERDDLSLFDDQSFDFVLSVIVLQHMPPELAKKYIAEFVRVLRSGGLAYFQIPSRLKAEFLPVTPPMALPSSRTTMSMPGSARRFLGRLKRRARRSRAVQGLAPRIEMYGLEEGEVHRLVEGAGGRVLDAREDRLAGKEWISISYFVGRP